MPKGGVRIMSITPTTKEVGDAFNIDVTLYNFGDNPIDVHLLTCIFDSGGNPVPTIPCWTDQASLGNQPLNRELLLPHSQAAGWVGPSGDYTVEVTARVYTGAVPETGEILDEVSGIILHVTSLQVTIMNVVAS